MDEATFTFRVDEKLKAQFIDAARAQGRSGTQMLRDFMRAFTQDELHEDSYDGWFRHQVEMARCSVELGALVANNDVEARFAERRAATMCRIRD